METQIQALGYQPCSLGPSVYRSGNQHLEESVSLQWQVWQPLCSVLAALVGKQPQTIQKHERVSVQIKVYLYNLAMGHPVP